MKKIRKVLLLLGIATVTIGTALTNEVSEEFLKNNITNNVKAYKHNPANILDNVFKKDGEFILPFIFENSDQTISKKYIVDQFKAAGKTIENQSSLPETIVTGNIIKADNKNYTVVIYGDVNQDGCVDVFDAQRVLRHYVYGDQYTLTGINELAANVNNGDNEVDVFDSQRILRFYVGFETNMVLNEPASLKELDKTAPVITLNGANPQIIKLGQTYSELGAYATDNLDKNVKVEINSSNVNTNKVGTYTVTYNATDASENKATEVKRNVIVQDYIKGIEIASIPNKITYNYGENIDLTGGKIKVVYASGSTKIVDIKSSMISGYSATNTTTQRITVSYKTSDTINNKETTFTKTFNVSVSDYVKGIEIVSIPTKTSYKCGENIDLTGGKIKIVYASGSTKVVDIKSSMISGYNATKISTQTITVSYKTSNTIDNKEATFTKNFNVNVSDYIKGIEIASVPNKITYNYKENIDLTGGKIKIVYASGNNKTIDIDANMISGYNATNITTQTITVSYKTSNTIDNKESIFTKTFNVNVIDYVKEIEIVSVPTKTSYKYGENIDLTGGKIKIAYASENNKTIDIDASMISGYDANQVSTQTVTISYKTSNTIDNKELIFTKTFDVTVTNYIKDIEISALPEITNYVEGQDISTKGLVINAVKANGEKLLINLSDSNLNITPKIATIGETVITVSYKTNDTIDNSEKIFSKTFDIYIMKKMQNINVTPQTTKGYCYEELDIAKIASGEHEANINISDLELTIQKDGVNITDENIVKLTVEQSQFDGTITMSLKATKPGKYEIIPKVEDATGDTITVTIEENTQVNKIVVGEVGEKFKVGQTRIIPINFKHLYAEGIETELEVLASKINVQAEGMEVKLLDKSQYVIEVPEYPITEVAYLSIKALTEGTKTLSITVDECSVNKDITILAEAKKEIKVNATNITLYLQKPEDNEMVKEDNAYTYPFTLIEIYLEDEEGNKTKLKGNDIVQIDEDNGIVNIIDSVVDLDPEEIPCICLQGYKKVGTTISKVSNNNEEIDYIGIALDDGAEDLLRNGYIKIFSAESQQIIEIPVMVPEKDFSNINVTPQTTKGYCYEEINIAKITSGEHEANINISDLELTIQKDGVNITDENIVKLTVEQSQFDGTITISLKATKTGKYEIIPKVGEATGDTITVIIEENTQVNKIVVGEIGEKFRVGQTRIIPINFKHLYTEGIEVDVNVLASEITKISEGIEVELLDKDKHIINVPEYPITDVAYLSIKALTEGTKTLSITVDKCTANKDITILAEAKKEIKVNATNITLYLQKPESNEMVKEDNDYTYPFTLIEIYLEDEDGNKTKLKGQDIVQINEENGNVNIIDNVVDADSTEVPCICLQGYKKDGATITKANNSEEIDYIGIAVDENAEELLRNGYIKIYNEDMKTPIKLNISIQN